MPDPYTLVYNEIWKLLERKKSFTDLVEESNRIKLTSQVGSLQGRRPTKDELTGVDVPEVMVYAGGTRFWELQASGGASVNKTYSVLVTSGSRLLDTGDFLPVTWAITKALYDYDPLLEVVFEGEKIVKKVTLLPVTEGMSDDDANRSLKGWASVWSVDVTLWFSNTILRGV